MGRSRPNRNTYDHPNQSQSKRKQPTLNLDNLEFATAAGQGNNEGKKPLPFHCNYCNKDISGKIRIKCVTCSDFDLCVECFSVGAEVHPHQSNHPYRVMDNMSFPLICPDWNADEEMLFLEGIEMYGWNWSEVAEHVGTKSRSQCVDHYKTMYLDSWCFPLPDMSQLVGKNKEELLAMARGQGEFEKGSPMFGELTVKKEPPVSAGIKVADQSREGPGRSLSSTSDSHAANKSVGEEKTKTSGDEGPSLMELSGYNTKRNEFEVEYDNDAEQLLVDMEFKDTDTDVERELKLRVLRIYSTRLDERKHRKDFIQERHVLYPDPFEKDLSPEEKDICRRYRVFMRFHSKEEHEELLKSLIAEHRIRTRIQDLKEARAAGCRTSAEAERYLEQKRKREADAMARKANNSSQTVPNGNILQRTSHIGGELAWNIDGLPGTDLLSEAEKRLCSEIRILPARYLKMLETMFMAVMNGRISQKSDAHSLFNVDPSKVDRVYDMLVRKGIIQQ